VKLVKNQGRRIIDLNNHNNIIPEKFRFNNPKRIEQTEKIINKETGDIRRATLLITESITVDVKGFYKAKDNAMVNLLIKYIPEGTKRTVLLTMLYSANRKNIVFDGSKDKLTPAKWFKQQDETISERIVQRTLKELIELNWIKKLNKYQYMVNPYYSTRNDISTAKIAFLQSSIWDKLEKGEKIESFDFPSDNDKIGKSEETKEDLKELHDKVVTADQEYNKQQQLKKEHLKEDLTTIEEYAEEYKKILINFKKKYDYSDKLTVPQIQHFSNYLKKAMKEDWSILNDIKHLHLDRTYKPLREIEKKINNK
jgi:DNA-binding HxlR family transcriptional regulator